MIKCAINSQLRGEFRAILYNPDGSIAHDSGWNSNLITDNGLYMYSFQNWNAWCAIGSNSTQPSVNDTTIGTLLASTSSSTNPMPYIDYPRPPVAPDWERWSMKKWRFEAGVGTGTVNEFTLGDSSGGVNIFCRHVLPAPIVKSAIQVLDIFYKFYVYIDSTPQTGTISVDGVNYDWEFKPINRDSYNYTLFNTAGLRTAYSPTVYDDTGVEGTDTSLPTGNQANHSSPQLENVITGRDIGWEEHKMTFGLDQWVTATNEIRYIAFGTFTYHNFQLKLTATTGSDIGGPLPKDNTEVISITVRLNWGRYVP